MLASRAAANSHTFKVTTPSDTEITLSRVFDAPPRLVFEAMTRPMLDYYADREELITVNGARPVPEVFWSITVQLQQLDHRPTQIG